MDAAAVFAIIDKGLSLLPILMQAGESVIEIINRMRAVVAAQAAGQTVSDDELNALEADLDAAIAKFNAPMD